MERLGGHLVEVASLEGLWLGNVGKLETDKARILIEQLLLLGSQFAQNFLDAKQLVDFGLAREESVTVANFTHNTPNCPNVNLFAIVVAEEKFGGAIPSCRDIICQTHASLIILEDSSKAKVTNFELIRLPV